MRKQLLFPLLLSLLLAFGLSACGGANRHHDGNAQLSDQSTGSELVLVNNSSEAIFVIQMSPSSNIDFDVDLLGSETLMIGASFRITGIGPGYWNIRVLDSSGNKKEFYRQHFDGSGAYHLVIDSHGWSR